MSDVTHEELADILSDAHLRERIHPTPGDSLSISIYPICGLALQAHATEG